MTSGSQVVKGGIAVALGAVGVLSIVFRKQIGRFLQSPDLGSKVSLGAADNGGSDVPKCKTIQVCVFCGSRDGNRPDFKAAGVKLGEELAKRDIGLVYGGGINTSMRMSCDGVVRLYLYFLSGSVGVMGALSSSVDSHGGSVQGIIPEALSPFELSGKGVQLEKVLVTRTMHERKSIMAQLSDAFIALPGG